MRASTRLLAQASKYLEAGIPTGLTGLFTHPQPRTALLYTYQTTLEKLKQFPESSVYRQSTEALTKHRLSIIESVRPEGLEAWQERVKAVVDADPQAYRKYGTQADAKLQNIVWKHDISRGAEVSESGVEPISKPLPEGIRTEQERAGQAEAFSRDLKLEASQLPRIEPEPPLNVDQSVKRMSRVA